MSNENNQKREPSVPHLPIGAIKAKAIDLTLGMTEKEDKEQLGVQFQITADGEHCGKMVSTYLFFTGPTIDVTLKAMRAMGWKGVDPTDLSGMDKEVLIVIEHEVDEKNGGKRARVRWVNAIGVAMNKPLQGSRLSEFRARVGAHAQKQAGANGAQTGKLPPIDDRPPPSDGDAPPWMRG